LLTDALSRRIIENVITPEFKSGNCFAGLSNASDYIFKILAGEFKGKPRAENIQKDSSKLKDLFIVIVLVLFFVFRNKNNRGGGYGNRRSASSDILTPILYSSMGRISGGFAGGSSSGVLGGGGFGGGFGSGGASES